MALTKSIEFYGFTTPAYVKIGGTTVSEQGEDESGKLYTAEVKVDWYTNATKEFHFKQETKRFSNLREYDLMLANLYTLLHAEPEFAEFADA